MRKIMIVFVMYSILTQSLFATDTQMQIFVGNSCSSSPIDTSSSFNNNKTKAFAKAVDDLVKNVVKGKRYNYCNDSNGKLNLYFNFTKDLYKTGDDHLYAIDIFDISEKSSDCQELTKLLRAPVRRGKYYKKKIEAEGENIKKMISALETFCRQEYKKRHPDLCSLDMLDDVDWDIVRGKTTVKGAISVIRKDADNIQKGSFSTLFKEYVSGTTTATPSWGGSDPFEGTSYDLDKFFGPLIRCYANYHCSELGQLTLCRNNSIPAGACKLIEDYNKSHNDIISISINNTTGHIELKDTTESAVTVDGLKNYLDICRELNNKINNTNRYKNARMGIGYMSGSADNLWKDLDKDKAKDPTFCFEASLTEYPDFNDVLTITKKYTSDNKLRKVCLATYAIFNSIEKTNDTTETNEFLNTTTSNFRAIIGGSALSNEADILTTIKDNIKSGHTNQAIKDIIKVILGRNNDKEIIDAYYAIIAGQIDPNYTPPVDPVGNISITPSTIDFGSINKNTSYTKQVRIYNGTNSAIPVTAKITTTNAISLDSPSCSTVAPNSYCDITVSIMVASSSTATTLSNTLGITAGSVSSNVGINAKITTTSVKITPDKLDFSGVAGQSLTSKTIEVEGGSSVSASATSHFDVSVSGTTITITPKSSSVPLSVIDNLRITVDGSTFFAQLTLNYKEPTPAGQISLSPANLSFSINIGETASSQKITVSNPTGSTITTSFSNTTDFTITDSCNGTTDPTCTVEITPNSSNTEGTKTATLTVEADGKTATANITATYTKQDDQDTDNNDQDTDNGDQDTDNNDNHNNNNNNNIPDNNNTVVEDTDNGTVVVQDDTGKSNVFDVIKTKTYNDGTVVNLLVNNDNGEKMVFIKLKGSQKFLLGNSIASLTKSSDGTIFTPATKYYKGVMTATVPINIDGSPITIGYRGGSIVLYNANTKRELGQGNDRGDKYIKHIKGSQRNM